MTERVIYAIIYTNWIGKLSYYLTTQMFKAKRNQFTKLNTSLQASTIRLPHIRSTDAPSKALSICYSNGSLTTRKAKFVSAGSIYTWYTSSFTISWRPPLPPCLKLLLDATYIGTSDDAYKQHFEQARHAFSWTGSGQTIEGGRTSTMPRLRERREV